MSVSWMVGSRHHRARRAQSLHGNGRGSNLARPTTF